MEGQRPGGAVRAHRVPADRRAAVLADVGRPRFLLVLHRAAARRPEEGARGSLPAAAARNGAVVERGSLAGRARAGLAGAARLYRGPPVVRRRGPRALDGPTRRGAPPLAGPARPAGPAHRSGEDGVR